jgi:hypothetical protein
MTTLRLSLDTINYEPLISISDEADDTSYDSLSQSFSSQMSLHDSAYSRAQQATSADRVGRVSSQSLGGRSSSLSLGSMQASFVVEEMSSATEKIVRKILKDWKEHIQDRFHSFDAYAKQGHSQELNTELLEKAAADRIYKDDYLELVSRTLAGISQITKEGNTSHYVRVLNCRNHPKAVASPDIRAISLLKVDSANQELYVSTLLIAPWNLPMNAPSLFTDYIPEKGSGALMLHSLCVTAQKLHFTVIRLKPLTNSVDAYKKLGMDYDVDKDEFTYTLIDGKIPRSLEARVSNLTLIA